MSNYFTRNRLRAVPFSRQNLADAILDCVGEHGAVDLDNHAQFSYIANYLSADLGCKWFILEDHYIDRSYADAFSAYYAKCLRAYPNYCQRFHFFARDIDLAWFSDLLQKLGDSPPSPNETAAVKEKRAEVSAGYLGFMTVRPQPSTFVGTTVLTSMGEHDGRWFPCVREYTANLLGVNLSVKGLAFQQQDRAVSACATAALWTAFHKTAHDAELKIPTPVEVTNSATRYDVETGRALPSSGLGLRQMCEAVRASGLDPEVYGVAKDPGLARSIIHSYLTSGMPVVAIAALPAPNGSEVQFHAVTVVGFREPGTQPTGQPPATVTPMVADNVIRVRGSLTPECYVHDDRFGPYAHVYFDDDTSSLPAILSPYGSTHVIMEHRWTTPPIKEHALLTYLLVPVYPKLRLKYTTALARSAQLVSVLQGSAPAFQFSDPEVLVFFQRSRDYKNDFASSKFAATDKMSFLASTSCPRWVAVARVMKNAVSKYDIVLDTTEGELGFPFLGIVLRDPNLLPFKAQLQPLSSRMAILP